MNSVLRLWNIVFWADVQEFCHNEGHNVDNNVDNAKSTVSVPKTSLCARVLIQIWLFFS